MQTPTTTTIGLNQWQPNDPVNMAQFNEDNRIASVALAAQGAEITRLYPEIITIALSVDGWGQDGDIWMQAVSDETFAAEDYSYHMAVAPADIFAAADLGGIIMASVADGSAIFQCRSQPEADIAIQIERTPRKEDA